MNWLVILPIIIIGAFMQSFFPEKFKYSFGFLMGALLCTVIDILNNK